MRLLRLLNSLSHSIGETDYDSIVWDYVSFYEPGRLWDQAPPEPAYEGYPVVDIISETRTAIQRQLKAKINRSDSPARNRKGVDQNQPSPRIIVSNRFGMETQNRLQSHYF